MGSRLVWGGTHALEHYFWYELCQEIVEGNDRREAIGNYFLQGQKNLCKGDVMVCQGVVLGCNAFKFNVDSCEFIIYAIACIC